MVVPLPAAVGALLLPALDAGPPALPDEDTLSFSLPDVDAAEGCPEPTESLDTMSVGFSLLCLVPLRVLHYDYVLNSGSAAPLRCSVIMVAICAG